MFCGKIYKNLCEEFKEEHISYEETGQSKIKGRHIDE